MAKNKISEYSTTAESNTDVGNIEIEGNKVIANFDNALRELMKHLADMNAGTSSIQDTFTFSDPSDDTKKARIDAGGVTAGQTRVMTAPDKDGIIALTNDIDTLTNDIDTLTASDVEVGEYIRISGTGFIFERVSSGEDRTNANGLLFRAVPDGDGSYHINMFGAAGSNTTDDEAIFNKAAAKGALIKLTIGATYLVNGSVTFADNTHFAVEGGHATVRSTATSALNVFAADSVNNIGISNINFAMPTGVSGYEVNSFHGDDIDGLEIRGCKFSDGYHSVELSDISNMRLIDCESDTPYSFGFYMYGSLENAWISRNYAHDSQAHDGIKIGDLDNTKIVHNVWITNNRSEDNFRDGLDIAHTNVDGVFISNLYTSGNSLKGIDIKMGASGTGVKNVWVDNCHVEVTASQVGASFITSDKSNISYVTNCGFTNMHIVGANNTNTEGILLDSVTDVTVSNCNFKNVKNALRLNGTDKATVKGISCRDCQEPINVSSSSGTGCVDTLISDVTCDGTTLYDLVTDGNDTGTIITNFRGVGEGGNGVNSSSDITFGSRVITKTSGTYQLRPQHVGSICTDNGAGGNVEFQLPPGINGLHYDFISKGAALIKIDPDGSELISGGTAGQQLEGSAGATVSLKWAIDRWVISGQSGSWSYV